MPRKRHPVWTIADFRLFAKARGGTLVDDGHPSRVPLLAKERLTFECQRGHRWTAAAATIKYQRNWCRKCIGISQRAGIEAMQRIASERGGAVVSKEYADAFTKLLWRCRLGHEFWMKPNHIQSGRWCPHCHAPRGERITRAIFEALFGKPFPKGRPPWLRTIHRTQMELDGYCEELGVAFEHQGSQHYSAKYRSPAHNLAATQKRDRRKRMLCRKHGVKLLLVPDLSERLHVHQAKAYILRLCARAGISLDNRRIRSEIDLSEAYSSDLDSEELNLLRAIASENGGRLVTPEYLGSGAFHEWECSTGHRWKARPINVKHGGNWCPFCAGRRIAIEDMRALARQKGGECLSRRYRTGAQKLRWRCGKCSHEWAAAPNSVKRAWCPECAKQQIGQKNKANAAARVRKMLATKRAGVLDLSVARRVAKERNGICLSPVYNGALVKLRWGCCECAHEWLATPNKVCRQGTWCPKCAAKKGGKKAARAAPAGGLRPGQVRARRLLRRAAEAISTKPPGRTAATHAKS